MRWRGRPSDRVALSTWAAAAGMVVAVLGPVLARPGYVLSYDLVMVPDPPLAARVLGTDGGAPRAVPSDLVVVALSRLLPADVVQKVLLVLLLGLAVAGAGRLAHRLTGCSALAAAAAGLAYGWSPFVAERLVLGQWALLLGVAALPWAVGGAVDVLDGRPGGLGRACAWTVPAALGGGNSTVLLAPVVLVVLTAGGRRGRRPAAWYATVVTGLSLPWLLPALLRTGGLSSDPAGVAAFAPRADGPLGTLGSLATLGGIWNPAVVPPERANPVLAVVALVTVLAALCLGGPVVLRAGVAGRVVTGVGGLGLAVPALLATGPGRTLLEAVVVAVPGGGLLRDGQKLVAGWLLLVAVCTGPAVDVLRRLAAPAGLAVPVALAAAVLPVALLPSLALGASGRLHPVPYPASWALARAALDADPTAGGVVVLPFASYRRFAWNGSRVVLDPAQRISGRPVVVDDRLPLRAGTVAGEDPRAAAVLAVLDGREPLGPALAGLGYRFVLLHRGQPGWQQVAGRLTGTERVVVTADLEVHRLPAAADAAGAEPRARADARPGPGRRAVQVAGLVGAALLAAGCLAAPALSHRVVGRAVDRGVRTSS